MTAMLTPMHADGTPNVGALVRHGQSLLDAGCSGLVLLGTTGEANSFSVPERQRLLEDVLALGLSADKLMVGTGCCALEDTVALTSHALSAGIERVLVLPPFYYKNVSDEGLFDAFARVIDRVGSDRLRLFLYLIPQLTGIPIGPALVTRLSEAFPKVIAGLKDSSGNQTSTLALCTEFGHDIDVMVGTEALLVPAMQSGASGCITAMGNIAAREIVQLYTARATADAQVREAEVNAVRLAFEAHPVIPALKAALARTTGDESWRNVRPPLRPLSPAIAAQLPQP